MGYSRGGDSNKKLIIIEIDYYYKVIIYDNNLWQGYGLLQGRGREAFLPLLRFPDGGPAPFVREGGLPLPLPPRLPDSSPLGDAALGAIIF